MSDDFVDKKTMAEYLDVSVRSIERYVANGMPHKRKMVNAFKPGWCIHYFVCYHESQPYNLKMRDGLTLTLFGYAIAGHDFRALKVKANEIAELMEYTDLQIGQSLGILKQSNLVRS